MPLETLEPLESRLERRALPQWAGGSLCQWVAVSWVAVLLCQIMSLQCYLLTPCRGLFCEITCGEHGCCVLAF